MNTAILHGRPSAGTPTLHAFVSWGRLGRVDRISAALVLVPTPDLDDFALLLSSPSKSLVVYLDIGDEAVLATVQHWIAQGGVALSVHDYGAETSQGLVRLHVDYAVTLGLAQWARRPAGTTRPPRGWPKNAAALAESLCNTHSFAWCELDLAPIGSTQPGLPGDQVADILDIALALSPASD